jgi:hypothetical protein
MDTSKRLEDNTLDSQTVIDRKAGHFSNVTTVLPLVGPVGSMRGAFRGQRGHLVTLHWAKARLDRDRAA